MKLQSKYYNSFKDFVIHNIALIFCIVSAIIAITICSKSSPIYPFNDWVDSNCYFTVGKSIFKGLVPYRDLVEQKGPFIYFVHALASIISYKTFLGVYFFEIISASFFLFYSYKTLELFCGKKVYLVIPFFVLIIFTSTAFRHGDSAEELCFPFIAYLIYIAFKNVQTHTEITNKEFIIIGITAACVFWTKFTLCGIFLGWYIPFFFNSIIQRKFKIILNSILFIILGLFAGTLPYLIYFGISNSLKDLFEIYIYDNIFLYSEVESNNSSFIHTIKDLIQNLIWGAKDFYKYYQAGFYLIILGGLYCFFRKWRTQLIYATSMFAFAFIFIFIAGRKYPYYSLGLTPIICLGFVPIFIILSSDNAIHKLFSRKTYLVYIIIPGLIFYLTDNRYLLKLSKKELPQYKFANIISQTPDVTLLNYGKLDLGLYTTTGIIPNCKYFCQLNVPLEIMKKTQDIYIEKGLCDYIVTFEDNPDESTISSVDKNNLYILVDKVEYWYEDRLRYYSLYKLSDI